jgi:LacI family transcriptional regulator
VGDLPLSPFPAATVVEIPLPARRLGRTAASMLLDRIEGDEQPPRTVVLRAGTPRRVG